MINNKSLSEYDLEDFKYLFGLHKKELQNGYHSRIRARTIK